MELKVPFYNVVNILLPGLAFIGICAFLFLDKIKVFVLAITTLGSAGLEMLLTVAFLAITYEVGYIIFRLGDVMIEPVLKKMFGWAEYKDFVAAQKAGAKSLEIFSREYGYARTQITLFIALAIVFGLEAQWGFLTVCVLCVMLFVLTARSHIKKTITTVNEYLIKPESEVINS